MRVQERAGDELWRVSSRERMERILRPLLTPTTPRPHHNVASVNPFKSLYSMCDLCLSGSGSKPTNFESTVTRPSGKSEHGWTLDAIKKIIVCIFRSDIVVVFLKVLAF